MTPEEEPILLGPIDQLFALLGSDVEVIEQRSRRPGSGLVYDSYRIYLAGLCDEHGRVKEYVFTDENKPAARFYSQEFLVRLLNSLGLHPAQWHPVRVAQDQFLKSPYVVRKDSAE